MTSVTFATKCWENDWEIILKTRLLENKILRNNYEFAKRVLIINNIRNPDKVKPYADEWLRRGTITDYYFVNKYVQEVLDFFELTKDSLGKGYYYSIGELTGIYNCETDYFLYFNGDVWLAKSTSWIDRTIKEFKRNSKVKVGTLVWNQKYHEAKRESFSENDDFYFCSGFSDQCFFVRTKDFRAQIYNEKHPFSERYPKYGGELFEKRVDSWLRNHGYLRVVYKHGYYVHESIPTNKLTKKLRMLTKYYDR
jgi:hypothetical protein